MVCAYAGGPDLYALYVCNATRYGVHGQLNTHTRTTCASTQLMVELSVVEDLVVDVTCALDTRGLIVGDVYCRTRVLARPQWLPSLVERAVTATLFEF